MSGAGESSRVAGLLFAWRKTADGASSDKESFYPYDLDEISRETGAMLLKLSERSLCDEVRALSKSYISAKNDMLRSNDMATMESCSRAFLDAHDALASAVGRELRGVL